MGHMSVRNEILISRLGTSVSTREVRFCQPGVEGTWGFGVPLVHLLTASIHAVSAGILGHFKFCPSVDTWERHQATTECLRRARKKILVSISFALSSKRHKSTDCVTASGNSRELCRHNGLLGVPTRPQSHRVFGEHFHLIYSEGDCAGRLTQQFYFSKCILQKYYKRGKIQSQSYSLQHHLW